MGGFWLLFNKSLEDQAKSPQGLKPERFFALAARVNLCPSQFDESEECIALVQQARESARAGMLAPTFLRVGRPFCLSC
jgi:hypothetical protein